MTDELRKNLEEKQLKWSQRLLDYDGIPGCNEENEQIDLIEKVEKLFILSEKAKLEAEQQKLETEKLEYQKEQDSLDRANKLEVAGINNISPLIKEIFGGIFKWATLGILHYGIEADKYGCISSKTTRTLMDFWTRPNNN